MRHIVKTFIVLSILMVSHSAYAYDIYKSAQKKQTAKDAKRWSLSQWMDQKKDFKLMDMWLMYNAPSPYEFFLSVDTSSFDQVSTIGSTETSMSHRNYRGSLGAFVTIVGLYGEYDTSDEDIEQWKALFKLRLLGSSDQSTNITIHYGLMNRDFNGDKTQYQVGGGKFNLYLLKAFALHSLYEHTFKAESEAGIESEGYRAEGGILIEYGALRFYGSWYHEKLDILTAIPETTIERKGILFGTRIYF